MPKGAAPCHTVLGLVPAFKMTALGEGMSGPSWTLD